MRRVLARFRGLLELGAAARSFNSFSISSNSAIIAGLKSANRRFIASTSPLASSSNIFAAPFIKVDANSAIFNGFLFGERVDAEFPLVVIGLINSLGGIVVLVVLVVLVVIVVIDN